MRTYLITGATGGIGGVIAQRLLEKGDRCAMLVREASKDVLLPVEKAYSETAICCCYDLAQSDFGADLFRELNERGFLPLDGFIHCAGVAPLMRVDENDAGVIKNTYQINLFSFLEIMKYFVREGNYKDGAAVAAISSVTAYRGSNRQAVYAGTKAALDATVRCMAKELIPKKIRVNSVVSGVVETEMLCELRKKSPGLDEKLKLTSPLGVIPPQEVLTAVEYLLSNAAEHITGTSMALDSGFFL